MKGRDNERESLGSKGVEDGRKGMKRSP